MPRLTQRFSKSGSASSVKPSPGQMHVWSGALLQTPSNPKLTASRSQRRRIVPSTIPFKIRIRWIANDEEESFLEKDQVVILLRQHQNNARNLALASFLFMSAGFLPTQRVCVDEDFIQALEVVMTEKFLKSRNRTDALRIFSNEIMKTMEGAERINPLCALVNDLESKGFFLGVLLPELCQLAIRYQESQPADLKSEVRRFSEFVRSFAVKQRGEKLESTEFSGKYIRVGIIQVGLWEKVTSGRLEPYLSAVNHDIEAGMDTGYLLAWGLANIDVSKKVAERVKAVNFGETNASHEFKMINDRGVTVNGIIIRLNLFKRASDATSRPSARRTPPSGPTTHPETP